MEVANLSNKIDAQTELQELIDKMRKNGEVDRHHILFCHESWRECRLRENYRLIVYMLEDDHHLGLHKHIPPVPRMDDFALLKVEEIFKDDAKQLKINNPIVKRRGIVGVEGLDLLQRAVCLVAEMADYYDYQDILTQISVNLLSQREYILRSTEILMQEVAAITEQKQLLVDQSINLVTS